MCLIIAKPAGVALPENIADICEEASYVNDDGFGFATPNTIQKHHRISPKDFASLLKNSIKFDEAAIIHFRYGTSGTMDNNNCHPFELPDGTRFVHNGNISYRYHPVNGMSDTAVFAKTFTSMEPLYEECKKLESSTNKFAILTPNERDLVIVGEKYGEWCKDGMWYSNTYWRYGNTRYSSHNYHYYNSTTSSTISRPDHTLEMRIRLLVGQYGYSNVANAVDALARDLFCGPYYND